MDVEAFKRRIEAIAARSGDGCWEWDRARRENGYGLVHLGGRMQSAHRAAYATYKGAVPTDMFVCHTCDNPPCCNPAHLFLGTPHDNNIDSAKKGRAGRRPWAFHTRCVNGHERTPENTYTDPDGIRECRICARARSREYQRKRRALSKQDRAA